MSTKKPQEKNKFWLRVICIALVVILIGSTVIAALTIF